jgi:HD-like signal output (HDOD) protein
MTQKIKTREMSYPPLEELLLKLQVEFNHPELNSHNVAGPKVTRDKLPIPFNRDVLCC